MFLNEIEAMKLLRDGGINVVETRLATSKQEAVSLSKEVGFPVVLKIVSPEVLHKSDAGGVKLGLKTSKQVENAYDDIITNVRQKYPEATIRGIAVQHMASPGTEVIIGMNKDSMFGATLMFGLGGIFVEIMKDVSFRALPLDRKEIMAMIKAAEKGMRTESATTMMPSRIPIWTGIQNVSPPMATEMPQAPTTTGRFAHPSG